MHCFLCSPGSGSACLAQGDHLSSENFSFTQSGKICLQLIHTNRHSQLQLPGGDRVRKTPSLSANDNGETITFEPGHSAKSEDTSS
jgi:hypothetical protein